MKTNFLPRPHRERRPAPEPNQESQTRPVSRIMMPWDTEPDAAYTAFPQAPESTGMLTQDLEPFRRTK